MDSTWDISLNPLILQWFLKQIKATEKLMTLYKSAIQFPLIIFFKS